MKKFIAFVLAIIMVFPTVVFANDGLEGFVSVREFFEEQGGTVTWDAEERAIMVIIDGIRIYIFSDRPLATVFNHDVELSDGLVLYRGVAYLSEADVFKLIISYIGLEVVTFTLTEEARDIALQDFDFLVTTTLENAVWDNIIYRRLGIDFDEHVAYFREMIENKTPFDAIYLPHHLHVRGGYDPLDMAADYLSHLLLHEFAPPLQGIGHLGARELTMYRMMLTSLLQSYANNHDYNDASSKHLRSLVAVYAHPQAVWFYGEQNINPLIRVPHLPMLNNNVTTRIIEENSIAYIRVDSFLSDLDFDDRVIFPFLHSVEGYDHLIIDLRGNYGGDASYFNSLFLFRLINQDVDILSHQFFTSGNHARQAMRMYYDMLYNIDAGIDWIDITRLEIISSQDFVEEMGGMPYFDQYDLERLTNVFVIEESIRPSYLPQRDRINFNGKVWLLVDDMSMSASVNAAMVVMSTGLGTVVGENTSGVTGPWATYVMLPNTGIIWRVDIGHFTDSYGRSIEEHGLTPNIRNREGMDALETVLAIISEMEESNYVDE